jgi:hypothetical protein
VKLERLDWLTDNRRYTERFAMDVGRRCSRASVRDVARELGLDWHTVKDLEKQYMRAQLAKAGEPAPVVIGIDEIAVRKRHTPIASSSAICSPGGRSGSAARTARRRAWRSSTTN